MIDASQGFDHADEYGIYFHHEALIVFTFLIYIFSNIILFMVFMNFIIAVISDSYDKVRNFALAHDYK